MAWIQQTKRKDGTMGYWIRDTRNGVPLVIDGGETRAEAELRLDQYLIRRDLAKEGYDDAYEKTLDELWGPKTKYETNPNQKATKD